MPLVTGSIGRTGAAIDVVVGIGRTRQRAITRAGGSPPPPVVIRAVVDTGASISGFASRVFAALDLAPDRKRAITTPSTPVQTPHMADEYAIALSLVAGGTAHPFTDSMWAIAADGFGPAEGIEGLIGRDVLDHCSFEYHGLSRWFQFAF